MIHTMRVAKTFAWLAMIMTVTYLLYGSSLNKWWCCDDTQILWHAVQYSPHEYFFVPEAWRSLNPYHFTPWLTLSYDIDYALFGLTPKAFYAHNLSVIMMCAGLIYLIARQWVEDWCATAGAVVFLVGTPVATVSQLLMARHYLEGLLFYLLALMLFMQGMRTQQARYGGLAGIAFAVAASAKEIYLPLGVVPFLLPLRNLRQRLRMAWPFLLVMLLYVPWRWHMLGEAIGGYSPAAELAKGGVVSLLAEFTKIPKLLWNPPGIGLGMLGLAIMFTFVWGRAPGRMVLPAVVVLLLALCPLIPLARYPGLKSGAERYFVAVWAVLALGVAVALGRAGRDRPWWNRWVSCIVVAGVIIPALNQSRSVLEGLTLLHAEYRAHGMALAAERGQGVIFATPGIVPWYSKGMIALRPTMGIEEHAPLVVADESELADLDLQGRRILRYNPASRAMEDITENIADMLTRWRGRLLSTPLTAAIEYSHESRIVHWKLGPSEAGRYVFLPAGEGGQIPIPPQGALRIGKPLSGCFRFRYDAPDGRSAYTALLSLDSQNHHGIARLSWQGASDLFLHAAQDSPGSACKGQVLSGVGRAP